jgi:hypothetical protein
MPGSGGLTSDRNAFQLASNATVCRFIETDWNDTILDGATSAFRNDYKTLTQWQMWTGQDANSIVGIFTNDLVYIGTAPNQKLRMSSTPSIGSILNNRGDRLSWVLKDIDNNPRGTALQRYDIGAFEFDGLMYISNAEVVSVPWPGAYRTGSGTFSDAEYVMTTRPVDVRARLRNSGNLPLRGVQSTVRVFRELAATPGAFDTTALFTPVTIAMDIPSTETIEVSYNLAQGAGIFNPQTYQELSTLGYVVPQIFSTMSANVTPLYKLEVTIQSDVNNQSNIFTKVVRFYLKRSVLGLLLSTENSFDNTRANVDLIAGKLNADTLIAGFASLGWQTSTNNPANSALDLFDRKGWEQKTVNYTMYRTMYWADGNDKSLSRYERQDLKNYLSSGTVVEKKNLAIGSQEMLRQNLPIDAYLLNTIFRADTTNTVIVSGGVPYVVTLPNPASTVSGTTFNLNVSNNGKTVKGDEINPASVEFIRATQDAGDVPPYCAAMKVSMMGEGFAGRAYHYRSYYVPAVPYKKPDSAMGVGSSTLTRNIIFMGVDWRHFGNVSSVMRGIHDFFERWGGIVIAVELLDFHAIGRGRQVELSWSTASEIGSDRFEIERAGRTNAGLGQYQKINEVKATGGSSSQTNYGPVYDRAVAAGSSYVYRLKMFDAEGNYKYSDEVEVILPLDGVNWLDKLAPNPATSELKFAYNLAEAGAIELSIVDGTGRTVKSLYSGWQDAGTTVAATDLSSLSSGTYYLVLRIGSETLSEQFSVVR